MFHAQTTLPTSQGFMPDDFLLNDPSPIPMLQQRPHRNVNYDKFDLGLMFDSSNYEEEDDEDYSVKEDLRKNQ